MIFEELKHLLPDDFVVCINDELIHHVDLSVDEYDYYEVTHIDAITYADYDDEYEELSVVVSLKETDTVHYGNFDLYLTDNSDGIVSAEQARGK